MASTPDRRYAAMISQRTHVSMLLTGTSGTERNKSRANLTTTASATRCSHGCWDRGQGTCPNYHSGRIYKDRLGNTLKSVESARGVRSFFSAFLFLFRPRRLRSVPIPNNKRQKSVFGNIWSGGFRKTIWSTL